MSSDTSGEAWMKEIQRRSDELDRGEVELIDDEDVYEQVQARIR